METQTNDYETLIGRVDVLINLMIKQLEKDGKTLSARDKIIMLNSFGLSPKDIAKVIDSNTNYVSVQLSIYRKKEKAKQGQVEGSDAPEATNEPPDAIQ